MAEQALKIKNTTATEKVFALKKRIRAVAGGTSASKTISILIWCIDYGQSVPDEMISVVSESYPHLEKGAILDFQMIMKDRGYWDDTRWHDTKHTYTFETGTRLEFFSPDAYGKVHGPRRDVLFANEANHLDFRIIDQLITRTARSCGSTGIPRRSFGSTPRCVPSAMTSTITLTYKDNEALDAQTIAEIESHRDNKAWWSVYGEGKLGVIESRIYRDWRLDLDEIPHEARLERYGLDFGYSNDPTAIVAVYELNGGYILDEVAYTKGLSNKAIADILLNLPRALVVADSAEPKSIDELKAFGLNVLRAKKGNDSVRNGIQLVQQQRVSITKRSININREYRAYLWISVGAGSPFKDT